MLTSIGGQALDQVDYLIAHRWELDHLMSDISEHQDIDAVASRVLQTGPGALCIPMDGGCAVYSHKLGAFTVPSFPSLYKDVAGARDALCAALATKLLEHAGEFSEEIALWATAAMAAATSDHGVPRSMPRRRQVESTLERSRFVVTPRGDR